MTDLASSTRDAAPEQVAGDLFSVTDVHLSGKPNECLMAPAGLCLYAQPHRIAPEFDCPAAELRARLRSAVESLPRVRRVASDDATLSDHYTQTSLILRFVDDIWLKVLPLEDGRSTAAIHSRSRVGYSDLGVNAKRVARILERLGSA